MVKPVWKKILKLCPHCPQCGVELYGNNSIAFPYICECGKWEQDWSDREFKIIKDGRRT